MSGETNKLRVRREKTQIKQKTLKKAARRGSVGVEMEMGEEEKALGKCERRERV